MAEGGYGLDHTDGYFHRQSQKMVFDGKRQRKPVQNRKTTDLGTPTILYLEQKPFGMQQWGGGWGGSGGMTSGIRSIHAGWGQGAGPNGSHRCMVPPAAWERAPVTSIHARWVHTSQNKTQYPINVAKFTPEGRRLITGASSGEFTLWSGLTFNFDTILQAHDAAVRAMEWSHNGNWMVTGDDMGIIKYWQPSMNNVKQFRAHNESLRGLSFSPSDAKFASCSDDVNIKIWDFSRCAEEQVLSGHGWDVKSVEWHPQKCLIASGSKDNLIKLWDPKAGGNIGTIYGHKNTVLKIAWNGNGNWLLSAGRDQLLKVFDLRTLREIRSFRGHQKEVTTCTWHPVHEDFFTSGCGDGSVRFWRVDGDGSSCGEIAQAHGEGHHQQLGGLGGEAVWTIDYHPAGHIMCTGGNDKKTKFWSRNRPGDSNVNKPPGQRNDGGEAGGGRGYRDNRGGPPGPQQPYQMQRSGANTSSLGAIGRGMGANSAPLGNSRGLAPSAATASSAAGGQQAGRGGMHAAGPAISGMRPPMQGGMHRPSSQGTTMQQHHPQQGHVPQQHMHHAPQQQQMHPAQPGHLHPQIMQQQQHHHMQQQHHQMQQQAHMQQQQQQAHMQQMNMHMPHQMPQGGRGVPPERR